MSASLGIAEGTAERYKLYAFVASAVAALDPKKVLDVAAGNGEGTSLIAAAAPAAKVVGLEIDPGLVASAKERFPGNGLEFLAGDARQLPAPDGHFDVVVSMHTLEHFDEGDQIKFLGELRRVLKPHGHLLISTPDREVWQMLGIAGTQADHIRELSKKEFLDIVSNNGFAVDRAFGQFLLGAPPSLLRRTLNFVKKFVPVGARRLLRTTVHWVDQRTSPVGADPAVVPLYGEAKASVVLLSCTKK